MKSKMVLAVCVLAASAVPALADTTAKLSEVSGQVLVDGGKGFRLAAAQIDLADGDRVLLTTKSKATVVYAEGCSVKLEPDTITTIGGPNACKMGSSVASDDGRKMSAAALFNQAGLPVTIVTVSTIGVTAFAVTNKDNAPKQISP